MSPRLARWAAWSLAGAFILLAAAGLILQGLARAPFAQTALLPAIILMSLVGIWIVTGAQIISRHPRHPVGWLLCAGLFSPALDMFSAGYAGYDAYVYSGSLPGVELALVWLKLANLAPFGLVAFSLIVLLFPDGRFPSPGWQKVAWTTVGALCLFLPLQAVEPGPVSLGSISFGANPLAVSPSVWDFLRPFMWTAFYGLVVCYGAASASLIVRLRKSRGDVRQQVKWLLPPVGLYGVFLLLFILGLAEANDGLVAISIAVGQLAAAGLVVAIAFAIFRYRLYDIDLILNRTLVYGTLTAGVVGLYVLAVGGAGLVFQANLTLTALLITGVVAGVCYRPMRAFFQARADQLTYGQGGPPPSRPRQLDIEDAHPKPGESTTPLTADALRPPAQWFDWARLAWYPAFAAALGIFVVAIPGFAIIGSGGATDSRFSADLSPVIRGLAWITVAGAATTGLLSLWLAALLFRRRAGERMALITSFFLLAHSVIMAGPLEGLEPFLPGVAAFTQNVLTTGFVPFSLLLFAVFPDGRFVPRWTRWAVAAAFLAVPIAVSWNYLYAQDRLDFSQPVVLLITLVVVVLAVAIWAITLYAQVYRYRNVSTPQQRQQTKWVVYGIGLWLSLQTIVSIPWVYAYALPPGTPYPWWLAASGLFWVVSIAIVPVTLTIAVLRYRLFDIDVIINRTFVYGTLSAGVVGLYLVIVSSLALAFQSSSNLAGALLTAVLVAFSFRSARAALQRRVDRWMPIRQIPSHTPAPSPPAEESPADQAALVEPADTETRALPRRWWRLARVAWCVCAAAALGTFILAAAVYLLAGTEAFKGGLAAPDRSLLLDSIFVAGFLARAATALFSLVLAGVLFVKRPGDAMALFLAYFLLVYGFVVAGPLPLLEPIWPGIGDFALSVIQPIIFAPLLIAFLSIFPNGRFVPGWTRWLLVASLVYAPVSPLVLTSKAPAGSVTISTIAILLSFAFVFAGLYAQLYRYRHVSTPPDRQQTKWVVYGFSLAFLFAFMASLLGPLVPRLLLETPVPWLTPLGKLGWSLAIAALPISLTIAVMRYRLYDIDLIINRTLVYGTLTASVMALYALLVGALGVLFQAHGNLIITLLTTGLVAVLFQPLRERLQRAVNRLTYGSRDDPVTVFSRLGELLQATASPEQMLPGLVRTIAETLRLPYAAIELDQGGEHNVVAAYGRPGEVLASFSLIYQQETIGSLVAAPRTGSADFGPADQELLSNVARQAGAVAHAVQLTQALQRSRARLVTAREEERRRLRRDLHDELGPQLASQTLLIQALERRLAKDPASAAPLLAELQKQSQHAVADIRRIVYDLRPPALDELGLLGALRESLAPYQRSGARIVVDGPNSLPALPAAVEVAAYRIVQEAVANVLRHARAVHCRVRLDYHQARDQAELRLAVEDDGVGLAANRPPGVGLRSMRERAAELGGELSILPRPGGGTQVKASLPLLEASR